MRVIGGKWRGRRLEAPAGRDVRPTGDRVREALFNILEHGRCANGGGSPLPDAAVLDAFAGTGALGIEALSRGAATATFIEKERTSTRIIARNIAACGAAQDTTVRRGDALTPPPAPHPCDIVFLDPPYGGGLAEPALAALVSAGWIADGALCIVELHKKDAFTAPEGFAPLDDRRYGATRAILLKRDG